MSKQIEALKLALEALRDYRRSDDDRVSVAMGLLQEALAEQPAQQQEPEHIVHSNKRYSPLLTHMMNKRVESNVKQVIELYDSPEQPASKPWAGLTDDEITQVIKEVGIDGYGERYVFAGAIEAKLKEKNA